MTTAEDLNQHLLDAAGKGDNAGITRFKERP